MLVAENMFNYIWSWNFENKPTSPFSFEQEREKTTVLKQYPGEDKMKLISNLGVLRSQAPILG